MNDQYDHGKEIGAITKSLEFLKQSQIDLTKTVGDGFSGVKNEFKNLGCKENTKILNKLNEEYNDNKVIKQHFIKTGITYAFKASPFILAFAASAYAYYKG